ncbi:MAG: hypothetical protein JJU20_02525 [Opitutales bacterium]|nr:hypothetical protein [Opitutales bacterium]
MMRLIQLVAWMLVAAFAFWLGMNIPAHFRSVSPLVLEAAGEGTRQVDDLALRHLDAGRLGPAELLWQAGMGEEPSEESRAYAEQLLSERPVLRYSGGPAPYWEQFVTLAPRLREDVPTVAASLLPPENREVLLRFLRESSNRKVLTILETRDLSGFQLFLPVYSSAGQPLDATILTMALLEQSNAFAMDLSDELNRQVRLAIDGDAEALMKLEASFAAILTLARRANWSQLESWMSVLSTSRDLMRLSRFVQQDDSYYPMLFAALSIAEDPSQLLDYIERHGDNAFGGIKVALPLGAGAISTILRFEQPLYQRPDFWSVVPEEWFAAERNFKGFAEQYPYLSLAARLGAFTLAGFAILTAFIPRPRKRLANDVRGRRLLRLDHAIGGVVLALLCWMLLEPNLLRFEPNRDGSLQLNLASVQPFAADEDAVNQTQDDSLMDQVTILILVMFFVIQLMVFVYGMLKMHEIRRQPIEAKVRLRLLDNEENLFDLGLYVGLFGTVFALILVVLNIVEASLMAAYASTLFGIIFVAFLKVGFLRPLRQRLILESEEK